MMSNVKTQLSAKDTADWFLAYAQINGKNVNALSLQKLLYFAQAHYLDEYGSPLFLDSIKAWEHGPAVPSVWEEHKEDKPEGAKSYDALLHSNVDFAEFDERTNDFLIQVWNTYGDSSPEHLEQKTHVELPWKFSWNKKTKRGTVISRDLILGYYRTRGELLDALPSD